MASNPALPAIDRPAPVPRAGYTRLQVFLALALVALATRLPGLGDPLHDVDEQLYHLIGVKMLSGQFPYVDLWDRKPFGLFAIYAFSAVITGGTVVGYQLLAAAFAAFGACQIYLIARRFADGYASLISGVFYLVCFPLFNAPQGQSEVFYLPLLLGMLQLTIRAGECTTLAAARRPILLAMLLGGLALQIKYTVLPQCLMFGLVALWRLHRLGADTTALVRDAAIFAALGLAPTALVAAGYALAGHFDAFVYANFLSIFDRGELPSTASGDYVRWIVSGASWLIALAVIALALVWSGRRPVQSGYGMAAAFLAASLGGVMMIGNIYVHYFMPAAAGLILLAAPASSHRPFNRFLSVIGLFMALGFSHIDYHWARGHVDRISMDKATAMISPYVGSQSNCLFVYEGPTALYQRTRSCLPSRLVYPDHFNNALEMKSVGLDTGAEVRRIFANRPGAVTNAEWSSAPLRNPVTHAIVKSELARNYTKTGEVLFPLRMVSIYVRNDLLKPPANGR